MINIKTIASGSSGNAYLISDGHTDLLLECGIKFKDLQIALEFKTSRLTGCLLTHEHKDHSHGLKDMLHNGIDVYTSEGTAVAEGITNPRLKVIESMKDFKIGTWTIKPFDVEHDASEPFGYFLMNNVGERLLFVTDSYYVRYKFPGLTHVMIECNYSVDILDYNIQQGVVPKSIRNRIVGSHFSLDNVKDFFKENDMSQVQEIHLMHLSGSNADRERFKREIQELTGKIVYIA